MQSKFPKGGVPPVSHPLTALPPLGGEAAAAPDSSLSAAFTKLLGARPTRDHLGEARSAGGKAVANPRTGGPGPAAPRATPAPLVRSGPRMGHK